MKITRFVKQFNPRFFLVRFLVNTIAVAITAAVTPKIYFVDKTVVSWLLITAVLGILNALLKPILQFLTLQFIFVTYGLVIVLVNTLILLLLSYLFPTRFAVDNLLWALVGGLVLGLLSSFLESLLGLTMPIVPDEPAKVRQQVEEQARHVGWLAVARHEEAAKEQALAMEAPVADATAAEVAVAEPTSAEDAAAQAFTPGPEEAPPPPAEVEAERSDSVMMPSAEEAVSEGPEPAPARADSARGSGEEETEEDRP